MACVATWAFGIQAVSVASECLHRGESSIEVLEKAVNAVEDDPTTGRYYVGRGCYPNAEGVVQLDAAIMRGNDCRFGAVAALEGYSKPISVAKRVLERTKVNILVGSGATKFAKAQGFPLEINESLLIPETLEAYKEYSKQQCLPPKTGHDTLSVLCLDKNGSVAAGISTSGPPFKMPGRVGDSPLPGCGLYADDQDDIVMGTLSVRENLFFSAALRLNMSGDFFPLLCVPTGVQLDHKAGAAAASGDGEKIMQFCPSFQIVQLMREGNEPQKACEMAVKMMADRSQEWFEVAVIALNTKGQIGAATTVREWTDFRDQKVYSGFPFAQWKIGTVPVICTQPAC